MIDKGGRGIIGGEVGSGDAWHAGETQLAKVGCVEKGLVGEIRLAGKCCGAVMVACRGRGNITAESYEKLVYSGELFWGADVERDGPWIKIRVIVSAIRVVLAVNEIVESFGHGLRRIRLSWRVEWGVRTRVIRGVDATFLDVKDKIVDGVVVV